ncbi:MAG: TolC family protein [Bacteroidales bacterium]|nr:TolC family protein [Bacteroidales bacterium]
MKDLKIIFLTIICLLSTAVFPQATTLSLNQLLDSAVQNNYLLLANEKNKSIKLADIEILKTDYQPQISSSASFSFWKFLLPNKQKLLGDALTDMFTDISVYQTVYDWGENKMKKSVVEDEILLNDEIRRQIHNTIVWGVSDTYFEALKAEAEIATHQNSLVDLNSHLKYAENLYKIGKVSGLDVLEIQVRISVEEKNLQKSKNALIAQEIKIKRLCYIENSADLNLDTNYNGFFARTQYQVYINDTLYNIISQNHPILNASERQIELELRQKELYRLENRPELFSYGVATWEHAYIPFYDNFNYNIGVGIRYVIPYFGGSGYKTRMTQSNYRTEQLDLEKNQAFLELKQELDISINQINDIRYEIENNQKIIRLADETLKNMLVLYQAGQGDVLDILTAQTLLTETTIAYKKSVISYLQTLARLHYLLGNDNYPF